MKETIAVITLTIFLVVLGIFGAIEIQKETQSYEKLLGSKFVIEKDTLTIIDYSTLTETFTLSDGRKISYALVGE